jgi:hypothetical protein
MTSKRNRGYDVFVSCVTLLGALGWCAEISAGSLRLTWSDSSHNADGFEIQRRPAESDVFLSIAIVAPHETSYIDGNLADNTTYCYRLGAYNRDGDSPYSDEFCATSSSSANPKAIATNLNDGAVISGPSVLWTAVPSGLPIRVEFFINETFAGAELIPPYQFNGDPSGNLDTNILPNGLHHLKVRAVYADRSTVDRTVVVTVSNAPKPKRTRLRQLSSLQTQ